MDSAIISLDPALAPKTECFNPELHKEHPAVTKISALEDGVLRSTPSFREVQMQGDCSHWAMPVTTARPSGPAPHAVSRHVLEEIPEPSAGWGQRLAPRVRSKGGGCGFPAQDTSTSTNCSSLGEPPTCVSDALPEHSSPQIRDCADLHAVGQHVQRGYTAWKREAAD